MNDNYIIEADDVDALLKDVNSTLDSTEGSEDGTDSKKSSADPNQKDSGTEEKSPEGEGGEVDPENPEATDEGDPEIEDFSLLPYAEKIKMVIDMVKEFGHSGLDYKINNGKNTVILNGKVDSELKTGLKELSKELGLGLEVEEERVDYDKMITKVSLKNKMDFKKFKEIMKITKKKEKDKEDLLGGAGDIGGMPAI